MTVQQYSASFGRRCAALIYDYLTAIAIAMVMTVAAIGLIQLFIYYEWMQIAPFIDVGAYLNQSIWFKIYLLCCLLAFFAYFWVNGGQTIGMRAWRLQVVNLQGQQINYQQALFRGIFSCAGLGNLWVLIDRKQGQSLQDHLAKTKVIYLTKAENYQIYHQHH